MKINLIIGAGQLGSRHLQALIRVEFPQKIFVLDPSKTSLDTAKKRAEEVNAEIEIIYTQDWEQIPLTLDLVIVATNANVRFEICKRLFSLYHVKFAILEKVLFQDISSFEEIDNLIGKKNTKVWVNHPRREWNVYRDLKESFLIDEIVSFDFVGSQWGLASNSLHLIDLCSYLSSSEVSKIDSENVDNVLYESKRPGFIEFSGIITGRMKSGVDFFLNAFKSEKIESYLLIHTSKYKYIIHEESGQYYKYAKNGEFERKHYTFSVEFQSALTTKVVDKIFHLGKCNLPTFKEASACHKLFILTLLSKYNSIKGQNTTVLPIT